jgi:hypothetical protein
MYKSHLKRIGKCKTGDTASSDNNPEICAIRHSKDMKISKDPLLLTVMENKNATEDGLYEFMYIAA